MHGRYRTSFPHHDLVNYFYALNGPDVRTDADGRLLSLMRAGASFASPTASFAAAMAICDARLR